MGERKMKPDIEKIKRESLTKMYEDALETMTDDDVIRMISEVSYLRKQLKSQSDVIARLKQEGRPFDWTTKPSLLRA